MAEPVRGLGIAVPVFMPVLVTAIFAVILSREDSAPLAYSRYTPGSEDPVRNQ